MRTTSSREVYRNPWLTVREDAVVRDDGSTGVYGVVEKPHFALVLPAERNGFWLVEQFRHPVGRRFWEFPQGAWEDAPDAPAEQLARGELAEETGLRAASMERVGTLFFAYGMSDQRFDVWLATGLEPGPPAPEATEHDLVCARTPVARFEAMVDSGEVADAATVAAWHLVSRR